MEIEQLKRAIREANREWLDSNTYEQASFFRETLESLEEELVELEHFESNFYPLEVDK